jgi:cyclic pyranopterin phosphate synthase
MTTNGVLLGRHAAALRQAGLAAVNVSLDSTDPVAFESLTRGGRLAATIEGICAACQAGFSPIKINTVLLRSFNGPRLAGLVKFAADVGCEIRFIELMPCGEGAGLYADNFLPAAEALELLTATFPYMGGTADSATARRHRLLVGGHEQFVGFITPVSHPFCGHCDRVRLDCYGRIVPCLREETKIDLLTPWRAGQWGEVQRRIQDALASKHAPTDAWPGCHMVAIGG